MQVKEDELGWMSAQGFGIVDQTEDGEYIIEDAGGLESNSVCEQRDWKSPNWENARRIHDWRNYISEEIRDMWSTFTDGQKKALAISAEERAGCEIWD